MLLFTRKSMLQFECCLTTTILHDAYKETMKELIFSSAISAKAKSQSKFCLIIAFASENIGRVSPSAVGLCLFCILQTTPGKSKKV